MAENEWKYNKKIVQGERNREKDWQNKSKQNGEWNRNTTNCNACTPPSQYICERD